MTISEGDALKPALDTVSDAAAVMLAAPSLSARTADACHGLLCPDDPAAENIALVTYRSTADERLDRWREHVGGRAANMVIISMDEQVRSAAATPPVATPFEEGVVRVVEQPGDLTGLGICLTEHLAEWDGGAERTALCFDSLTSLLQYVDVRTAFRFLHVMLNQLRRVGGVGHVHVDPGAHDDRTVNQLKQLFDAVVHLDGDEATVERR